MIDALRLAVTASAVFQPDGDGDLDFSFRWSPEQLEIWRMDVDDVEPRREWV